MKHIEILECRRKKNQITALQILFEPRHCRLRHTFHASTLWIETRHNIQNALLAECRYSRHRNRLDYARSQIVTNPLCHIVIAAFPLDAASFIADLSQPLDEVTDVGRASERYDRLDIGDTVESIERSREHFGRVGRSNQRIRFVGISEEVAGENLNPS